jgi:DNA-binding NtrC family response regulator/CHASE2 domain-containing sensor protein
MTDIFIRYKFYLKIIILLLSFLGLYFAKGIGDYTNEKIESLFYLIGGERPPDSNIVIIHITEEDLQKLGAWPLKRSYYALLINQLTQLNAKKIGLEIFISGKVASQSVYNKLLDSEIKNSGKVILASTAEGYNKNYNDGKILFPEPKTEIKNIRTGHINFIEDGGLFIPLRINYNNTSEPSFALALSGLDEVYKNISKIKINFLSEWKKFKNYSLLEFFELSDRKNTNKSFFNGKIIIIGVSDDLIATHVSSAFEDRVPGVAIHAFALDNLIQKRYIKTNLLPFSAFLIVLILSGFVLFEPKSNAVYRYLIFGLSFILISFILFYYFYYEIHYALYLIPFVFISALDLTSYFFKRKIFLTGVLNESGMLKKALEKKESQLLRLQKELNVSGENASQEVIEKIAQLKLYVEELKVRQADDQPSLPNIIEDRIENFRGLVYRSKQMASLVNMIKKVAPEEATVLLLGESGTGKELVANIIHQLSKRKENNFVAFNCAALSETLLESELFGHVKGAFTNAISDKTGRFEAADKGTIFLDEIGETTENFQSKLLRILQNGEYEKVGSSKTLHVSVRIIAATNKKLDQLVKEKKFREDLYYRLNVIKIELSSLRERKEDIEILANYFLKKENNNLILSKAVVDQLKVYSWKGNVRELESAIKRASIFAKSGNRNIIKLGDLPEEITSKSVLNIDEVILESLREKEFSHTSINETAKELELSRTLISENFRGIVLKTICLNEFNINKTIDILSPNGNNKSKGKINVKIRTFLSNIEKDVLECNNMEFDEVKKKLNYKYKNLPQKFHPYLDEIIKTYLR